MTLSVPRRCIPSVSRRVASDRVVTDTRTSTTMPELRPSELCGPPRSSVPRAPGTAHVLTKLVVPPHSKGARKQRYCWLVNKSGAHRVSFLLWMSFRQSCCSPPPIKFSAWHCRGKPVNCPSPVREKTWHSAALSTTNLFRICRQRKWISIKIIQRIGAVGYYTTFCVRRIAKSDC